MLGFGIRRRVAQFDSSPRRVNVNIVDIYVGAGVGIWALGDGVICPEMAYAYFVEMRVARSSFDVVRVNALNDGIDIVMYRAVGRVRSRLLIKKLHVIPLAGLIAPAPPVALDVIGG